MNTSTFKAYTNLDSGFSGVVPEGWIEKRPGEFGRGNSDADPTFLAQLGVPGATLALVTELLLPKLGLTALPERAGSIENANLAWDVYTCEIQVPEKGKTIMNMALSQGDAGVYVVLFGAKPDEYDDMHYAVFLRTVDALTPTTATEESKRIHPPQKTILDDGAEVVLIKGEKLENDASDVVADLLLTKLGLRTAFIELDALNKVNLQAVKLIYFPGGESASIHLSEKAAQQVRKAVGAGTGYIGTCAGAFLAAEATTTASHIHLTGDSCPLGIFPGIAEWGGGEGVWPFCIDVRHPILANSSFVKDITPVMNLRFSGGTSNLVPSYANQLGNWRVATLDRSSKGTTMGKRAAMTATVFGKGRVFLSGPHPEAQEDTHGLLLAAAEWCTGKSDPIRDTLPIAVMDIPTEGVANRFLVCSAAGSHDPERYPLGFIWDFGDGSSKQYRPEAIHIYEKPGTYPISLTVTTGTRHRTKSIEVKINKV